MKTMLYLLLSLPALLTLGATNNTVVEIPEFKTYDIGFSDGSNATEIVKTVVGESGKVFYDPATRKLMVLASSNSHAAVAGIIRQLSVPPRNVNVAVRFLGQDDENQRSASISAQGGVVINNSGTHSTIRIQPNLADRRTETSSNTRQQLLVASGRQASIFIGEEVPYIEWLMEYGRRYHYIEQQLSWQRVGATLVIEPVVIGDGPLIRIKLTPELSGLVDNNPYRTRFANVATEVTVSDGVPFTLGGLSEKNEFYTRFLIGMDRSGRRKTLDIELTATIIPPEGPGR
jgi:type II secretory pathway component GspD/PulD (secretin)